MEINLLSKRLIDDIKAFALVGVLVIPVGIIVDTPNKNYNNSIETTTNVNEIIEDVANNLDLNSKTK